MKNTLFTLLLLIAAALNAYPRVWNPDSLLPGDRFETTVIEQHPDYSGAVCSTVIRHIPAGPEICAVLYVHGFNDYFFQQEMAERFVSKGYGFYAVDLRKYGRSLRPSQKHFQVRDLGEYFADIDSAISVMRQEGVANIILMGHSTGGLITALYMSQNNPPAAVRALILNSPFLDWNLSPFIENIAIPAVSALGAHFPDFRISQGASTAYSESLLRQYDGEWEYDTDLKLIQSPDVDAGWIRAIDLAQQSLRDRTMPIRIPILLMHSIRTVDRGDDGDAVLDVRDINRYGRNLGCNLTILTVPDGLHDLVLSRKGVRDPLFRHIFSWLQRNHLSASSDVM